MTEYQFYDLLSGTNTNLIELVTVFFSIFVAYLVCVYLVGSKISKIQSIAITFVYSIFSLFLISLIYQGLITQSQIIDSYYNIENSTTPLGFIIGPGTLILSWLFSVIYMIQVRYQKIEKE